MPIGVIHRALSGFYDVFPLSEDALNLTFTAHEHYDAHLVRTIARGRFRQDTLVPRVGDHVEYSEPGQEGDDLGRIERILPRKNTLTRPPLANLDALWIVFSLTEPPLSLKVLDRLLVRAEMSRVPPVLIWTKFDHLGCQLDARLKTSPSLTVAALKDIYEAIGYSVYIVTLKDKDRLPEPCSTWEKENEQVLLKTLPALLADGRYVAVAGPSGVGKSTLISTLSPLFKLARGEVSKKTERGRHTTRVVSFIPVARGWVADTPGFTALELEGDPRDVASAMPEFLPYIPNCRYRACLHLHEPGCAVKEAVEAGKIAQHRYAHYRQFVQELQEKETMRFR